MEWTEEMAMELWDYIDGSCTDADKQRIAHLIDTHPLWQQQYNAAMALHADIATSLEIEQPSMRFTKNVMEAVAATQIAPAAKKYINTSIIKGIAAFFIVAIVAMLGYAIANTNPSVDNQRSLPKLNMEKVFTPTFFMAVIGVNIILALALLDVALRRKQSRTRMNNIN